MAPESSTTKKRTFRRLKQFRCEGYGDCDMVFSRSEHLARHVRKHTGEKPFKCDFPDCHKQFSRFDNMRQHAHTHQRFKKLHHVPTEDVPIQPRPPQPFPSFTLVGVDQMNPRATFIPGTEGAQTAVTNNQATVGWKKSSNTTSADSPSSLPHSSTSNNNSQHGLVSPVSLSGTFEEHQHQDIKPKKEEKDLDGLTQDELDALDGLNQFRQSPQATSGSTTRNGTK